MECFRHTRRLSHIRINYARNVKRTTQHQGFNICKQVQRNPQTVRNDLKMLEEKGLVIRTF
ncbi:DeoR family transcriptional regulator [Ligilactobacillus ruminis]|uniref:DeoR family transcriptional regulator n=1 Tax=Ligilactobacillus ruminis TaxID=1623 RepID=UPI00399CDCA9|nr:DeoR family transcriptional regulator [Ligilactobacillus ruminis]